MPASGLIGASCSHRSSKFFLEPLDADALSCCQLGQLDPDWRLARVDGDLDCVVGLRSLDCFIGSMPCVPVDVGLAAARADQVLPVTDRAHGGMRPTRPNAGVAALAPAMGTQTTAGARRWCKSPCELCRRCTPESSTGPERLPTLLNPNAPRRATRVAFPPPLCLDPPLSGRGRRDHRHGRKKATRRKCDLKPKLATRPHVHIDMFETTVRPFIYPSYTLHKTLPNIFPTNLQHCKVSVKYIII